MNKIHPFGLPIWKPALYKKSRSVVRSANRALHSSPSSAPELFLNPGNILWFLLFGWWLALVIFIVAIVVSLIPFGGSPYSRVLRELAFYLLWPFGRYVERQVEIKPTHIGGISSTSSIVSDQQDEETGLLCKDKKAKRSLNPLRSIIETIQLGPGGILYYLIFWCVIGIVQYLRNNTTSH
jgi:Ca2+:H+ antiporter